MEFKAKSLNFSDWANCRKIFCKIADHYTLSNKCTVGLNIPSIPNKVTFKFDNKSKNVIQYTGRLVK